MRELPPAPDEQVQPPNVHWAQIVSDEPIEVHVGTGRVVTEFIRAVRDARVLQQADPLCGSLLLLMLDLISFKELQSSHRLVCWPSRSYLAWHTGRAPGHVSRAIRSLKRLGIVRVHEAGGGTRTTTFELVRPEPSPTLPPCAPARRVSARQRAGSLRASAQGDCAPARTEPARQRALPCAPARSTLRAGAQEKLEEGNWKNETSSLDSSSSNTTAGVRTIDTSPDLAAAAAELEAAGIGAAVVEELIARETTTRAIARAAIIEASKRPEQYRAGLIVTLMRDPKRIAQKNLSRATKELAARPAAAAADPGGARDDQALSSLSEPELLRLVDRVLAKYPSGKLRDSLEKWKEHARTALIWRAFLLSEIKLDQAAALQAQVTPAEQAALTGGQP